LFLGSSDPGLLSFAHFSEIPTNQSLAEPGTPVVLFQTRIIGGGRDIGQGRNYDVSRDGRFLINNVLNDIADSPITLIQNWSPSAK
jgi:hypothetical protein